MQPSARRKHGRTWTLILAMAAAALAPAAARAAEQGGGYPQEITVANTFDGRPFTYRVLSAEENGTYSVLKLAYPSPTVTEVVQNNTIPAEYYLPTGVRPEDPKRPAVICLHILDGSMELVRIVSTSLAARGVPAIIFKLPYYGERGLPEGPEAMAANPKLFTSAVTQALGDVRRTVDVLASRPEVNPEEVGIVGISLGGIVAVSSAEWEPRISRTALILAGGDLNGIIRHARETQDLSRLIDRLSPEDRKQVDDLIATAEPLRNAEKLRARAEQGKVLMVNATNDEVIPRACTEKLAAALGISDRVMWLDGLGHYTAMAALPQVLKTTVDFFVQDLPAELKTAPPPAVARTSTQVVAELLQQAAQSILAAPAEGRCRFADLEVSVTPEGQQPVEGRIRAVVGADYRFRLECRVPGVGEVALGQGRFPWLASPEKKVVYCGTGEPAAASRDPLALAAPQHLMKVRVVGGALAGVTFAPEILEQLATISDDPPEEGRKVIRLELKGKLRGTLRVVLKDDGRTPDRATFDVGGARGTVTFHTWQPDTVGPKELFEPPAGFTEKEVSAADVCRMFSAMFDFALENVK